MSKPPFLSIRRTIPVLIVAPLLLTVVLSSLLSYFNSRHSVKKSAERISEKAALGIQERLTSQLATPQIQIQSHAAELTAVEGELEFAELQDYLWQLFKQASIDKDDAYTYFATEQGQFIGLWAKDNVYEWRFVEKGGTVRRSYNVDAQGQPTDEILAKETAYVPQQRAWYQAGQKAEPNQSAWSEVYVFTGGGLGLSAVQPVFRNDEFLGVFGVDVRLTKIQKFLKELDISKNAEIFVIERDGKLIATSTDDRLYREVDGKDKRIDISEIENSRLRAIAQELHAYKQDWQKVTELDYVPKYIDGQNEFVTIAPFRDDYGLDWLVVVALPESDFRKEIRRNAQATVGMGTVLAIIGTGIGLMVARWVVRPIDNLNNAARAIEDQRFQPMVLDQTTQRPDELGELATVFQRMGTVISANQASLEEQKEVLEAQVAQAKRQQQGSRKYTLAGVQGLLQRSQQLRSRTTAAMSAAANPDAPIEVTVEELLYQVSYFAHLNPQDIQQLLAMGRLAEYATHDLIFAEDAPGDSFYIIVAGAVDITVEKLNKFLTHLEAGSFFGELSLLLGLPRTATVHTTEPTTVFCLDQDHLRQLIARDPTFADRIATEISAHREELASRQALLLEQGIITHPEQVHQNPLGWIRQRLQNLFGSETPVR